MVFPTYNERDSIRAAIVDFAATGVVDEIIVVNNNAAPGTSEEVAAAGRAVDSGTHVREVHEYRQGYGYAIQRGLRVIQVPVNYLPRIGQSSVTGDLRTAIKLGVWMIGLVFRYRLRSWFNRRITSGTMRVS